MKSPVKRADGKIKLPDGTLIDPSSIPDSAWEAAEYDPDGAFRTDRFWIEKPHGSFGGMWIERKVNLFESDLLELNKERYKESEGKRWGDGKSVASIPLNIFYRDFATRLKDGDTDFTKWWLNKEENTPYRNFKGKI